MYVPARLGDASGAATAARLAKKWMRGKSRCWIISDHIYCFAVALPARRRPRSRRGSVCNSLNRAVNSAGHSSLRRGHCSPEPHNLLQNSPCRPPRPQPWFPASTSPKGSCPLFASTALAAWKSTVEGVRHTQVHHIDLFHILHSFQQTMDSWFDEYPFGHSQSDPGGRAKDFAAMRFNASAGNE